MGTTVRKAEIADAKRGRPQAVTDTELLATGEATKAQIAKLFRRDPKTLDRLLYGLIPSNVRRGVNVYSIEEAASRLVKPGYQIEGYIRRMHQADLPPLLQKEFWNGLRARQAFEREQGDLWPTAEVVSVFAEVAATLRMSLLLMPDEVDREAAMTVRQREVLKRLTDAAIVNLQDALVEKFSGYEPPNNQLLEGRGDSILDAGPASGHSDILDAPDYEEDDLGLLLDGGVDTIDSPEDTYDPGETFDL